MKNLNYNFLLLLLGLGFMVACSSTTDPVPTSTTLTGITVARTTGTGIVKVTAGETLNLTNTFTVTPTPANAKLEALTWTVDAKSGSSATAAISGTTLTAGTTAGDMTLTVKSGAGTSAKSATIDITIEAATLASFTIGDPTGHALGTALDLSTLTITTVPTTVATGDLTWTIPTETAGYSITNGTLNSVVADATSLTVTVQAATAGTPPVMAMKTITFPAPALTSFAVGDPTGTLALGTALDLSTLTITTVPATAVTGDLTWTIPTTLTGYSILNGTLNSNATNAATLSVEVQASTAGTPPVTAMKTITFPAPALTSIAVARSAGTDPVTVATGGILGLSTTFTVTPSPSTATVGVLTWTVAAKTGSTATATITGTTFTAGSIAGTVTLTVSSDAVTPAETATIDITIEASAPPALVGFTIEDPTGTLALGTSLDLSTLTITTDPVAAVTGDLTWSIPTATAGYNIASGSSLLASDAIAATGLTVIVQATTSGASPKTAMKTITFPAPALTKIIVRRTMGTGPVSVPTGGTLNLVSTFTVIPTPPTATVGTLTWAPPAETTTMAGGTVAGVIFTAGSVTGNNVAITVLAGGGLGAIAFVNIVAASVAPTSITITRKSDQGNTRAIVGVPIDVTTIFDVAVEPSNADASVRWSIATGAISTGGTITPAGMFTATAAGNVILTATSTVAPSISDTTNQLTVNRQLSITVTISGITTISSTTGITLSRLVSGDNQDQSIVWSINPAVPGASITPAGVLSVTTGVPVGTGINVVATHTASGQEFTDTHAVTVVTSSQQPPAAVERTNADLQGMIVGSTGHFYAHTTTAEKKMTIVLDGNTMHLNHDATASTATDLHFKTTDDRNTMVLNVPATGTPTVTSLNLMGHAGAVAEVTTVDHSTTTAATEVPLIFEGYETFYGIKRSDYTTPIDLDNTEPTAEQKDAKIELYKTHYNVVVKGGTNAKLVVMANFITTEAEKTRLAAIWSAANIGYNPPFPDIALGNHPNKFELTISSRTDTVIVATNTAATPPQTITFPLTTEHGKLKMIFPLEKLIDNPVTFVDKSATKVSKLKRLHIEFTKEGGADSDKKIYKFLDEEKFNAFLSNALFSSYYSGIALSEANYLQAVNALAVPSVGATAVTTSADAYELRHPDYSTYQYRETVLTEVK